MKCDTNIVLKTAAGLVIALAVAYLAVPAAHAFILASAPVLVALICPVSMLFMMKAMHSKGNDTGTRADGCKAVAGLKAAAPGEVEEHRETAAVLRASPLPSTRQHG